MWSKTLLILAVGAASLFLLQFVSAEQSSYLDVEHDWPTGMTAHICMLHSLDIQCGWQLEVIFSDPITRMEIWDATILSEEPFNGGTKVVLENKHWNEQELNGTCHRFNAFFTRTQPTATASYTRICNNGEFSDVSAEPTVDDDSEEEEEESDQSSRLEIETSWPGGMTAAICIDHIYDITCGWEMELLFSRPINDLEIWTMAVVDRIKMKRRKVLRILMKNTESIKAQPNNPECHRFLIRHKKNKKPAIIKGRYTSSCHNGEFNTDPNQGGTVPPPTTVPPTTPEPPTTKQPTTQQPTNAPTTQQPTNAPTTQQPTNAPTTQQPTNAPTTQQPTNAPTTQQPTNAPTTQQPTNAPTTQQPTNAPTTQQPTNAPTTQQPTNAPTTQQPTNAPTTQQPTNAPTTQQPTNAPTTQQPTNAPTTQQPTNAPTTQQPTNAPTTQQPTNAPTTQQPTNAPTTQQPTNAPTSQQPTNAPTTQQPTNAPTTQQPTNAPTTQQPTNAPTTQQPTNAPTTQQPTNAPTTQQPTNAPTTQQPTNAPTTQQPTNAPTTQQPTNAPTTQQPTTIPNTPASPVYVPAEAAYDYGDAMDKSMQFYFAQRSGPINDNIVPWRTVNSAMNDGSDVGKNLVGGWYDAGDYVKFGFPMAASVTNLLWGLVEFKEAYKATGELEMMYKMMRHPLEYFLKCWSNDEQTFYGQVGKGSDDHGQWGRPEDISIARPAYKLDENNGGSDLAGETAAALAAGSMAFEAYDPRFAQEMLTAAEQLYDFADKHRRVYHQSIPDAATFYRSYSGFEDELCWGAAWLFAATGKDLYKNKALQAMSRMNQNPGEISWDSKEVGCYTMMLKYGDESNKDTYASKITQFMTRWLSFNNGINKTPCGLAWLREWGALRYSANTALIGLMAADNGVNPEQYRTWAERQIKFMLGANEQQISYLIGYGDKSPRNPHHRAASCPLSPATCSWTNYNSADRNPHELTGALVGGPDRSGNYEDKRSDYVKNEVTTDYNAGFQSVLAGLVRLTIDRDLPRAQTKC